MWSILNCRSIFSTLALLTTRKRTTTFYSSPSVQPSLSFRLRLLYVLYSDHQESKTRLAYISEYIDKISSDAQSVASNSKILTKVIIQIKRFVWLGRIKCECSTYFTGVYTLEIILNAPPPLFQLFDQFSSSLFPFISKVCYSSVS